MHRAGGDDGSAATRLPWCSWGPAGGVRPRSAGSPAAPEPSERAEYVAWLTTAPTSPLAAIAQQPIGAGLRLGPADADVPLDGVAEHRVTQQGGAVTLDGGGRQARAWGAVCPSGSAFTPSTPMARPAARCSPSSGRALGQASLVL